MVPPWMRYTPKTPFSQPTRDHHGTHQGDTAEYPPTVRPRHPLPAGSLPRARPTPEQIAPPPPWKRYTPATHRHSPPAGTAPGPQHAQEAATHRPADPANAIPRTTGPTQRWADTPKHHTTTPPWLRHSSPAHPAPGDPRPHATPTPHGPRTETRQEDDQETTRGCPTPPGDKPRATTHPTRPGHGAPPPPNGKATTQHNTTIPHRTPLPHPGARDTTAHQHRNKAAPRRLRTPPHRHHPWKPRTPRASSTPTTGHNPNRTQGQHHRPGQPPACSHTPQPRQTAHLPRRTTPHQPPHVPRTPASHAHRAMKQHPNT